MASLDVGKRLADRYVLLERLGDGGHAEVWAAQDEATGKRVALKFLHLHSCSADEAWLVLSHEARMSQRLDHPGVLNVAEPQRDGWLAFLPMEYAGGGDASQLRGASWRRVLPVLLEVARVLEHAHSRGVVHRDIKPGNVLFDAGGAVRVTDFGAASRTGSTRSMSAGSPFSASPQQLRGEAATTADDVYGLGALAQELLTRYPPHYPDFDPQRVQREDPSRPVPAQPAPSVLLDFIVAMLARDAGARPDLQQVMQVFEDCLENEVAAADVDEVMVTEAPVAIAAPPRRRLLAATGWLALAGVIAVAAFLLLPRIPQQQPVATPVAVAAAVPPQAVADAIVEREVPVAPVEKSVAASPTDALRDGVAALAAGKAAVARAAFQRALAIEADNQEAQQGLKAAAELEQLLAGFAAATRAEARGDLAAARAQYQALLASRADFAPAQEALVRVQARQRADEFEALLRNGVDALRQGQLQQAEAAYTRAATLGGTDPRVRDGQARLAEVRRDRLNAEDLATGARLEREERWQEAIAQYQASLTRDASLLFAQDGLARSRRRAELDAELGDYIARPERLSATAVRAAADRAMARAEATSPQTARLAEQLSRLKAAMLVLASQVRVAITSDNSTQVSVAQLGELGAFRVRELALPPGRYTVIGRRDGFRDVRLELDIAPGQRDAALSVQCTERI